jgi:hypothetical protein
MGTSWPAISFNVRGQPTKSDVIGVIRIRLTIDDAGRSGTEVCDDNPEIKSHNQERIIWISPAWREWAIRLKLYE